MSSEGFTYIVMGILILCGVYGAVAQKPFFITYGRYTEESLKKFCRPAGIVNIVAGIFGLGFLYTMNQFFKYEKYGVLCLVCLALFILVMIIYFAKVRKILVKNKK
ncbi:MAG: hypothetical protein PHC41_15225 [Lachnospiraceae bacterium]|nr:hypothetical protein [Lachnospiraceae bacterium]MDD3617555.1 hypothetical protein [Lachnospiraceae bacterium]